MHIPGNQGTAFSIIIPENYGKIYVSAGGLIFETSILYPREGDLIYIPLSGSIYEINNRIIHSAFNNGMTNRVHVILDIMDLNRYNDALLTKQNFMEKI